MKIRAIKKLIFVCALAAAAAGLASCTDLSYAEFDDESTAASPDTSVPAAAMSLPDSDTPDSSEGDQEITDDDTQSSTDQVNDPDSSAASDVFAMFDPSWSGDPQITSQPDSSSLPDDDDKIEPTPQYLAYREIIAEYYERFLETDSDLGGEYCRYYITDIDSDGTYELICETGTFQADRTAHVFTFDGERIIRLGEFITWHAELVEGNGCIYSETLAMGSSILYEVSVADGTVTTERSEDPLASMPYEPLEFFNYDDLSGLDKLLEIPPTPWFGIYNQ